MKKRILAVITVVVMIFTLIPAGITSADSAETAGAVLKFHYNRPDGNYDGWSLWVWNNAPYNDGFDFAEEDGEMVATVPLSPSATEIGYIVRKGDWEAKDIDADQFFDVAEMVSGTVHAYVESGVEGARKEYGDDAVKGVRMVSAMYDGDKTITATFTAKIEDDLNTYFSLSGKAGAITIEKVEAISDLEYHLTIAEKLDLTEVYTITANGNDSKLTMPNVYSTKEFEDQYTYTGNDLGATYTKEKTTFRVWAPTAKAVKVYLYKGGRDGAADMEGTVELEADVNGTWVGEKEGDLAGKYYKYSVDFADSSIVTGDPYARSAGVNGNRSMILDLDSTDPEGWENDKNPNAKLKPNDAIIYEVHIRDISMDENSGITNKGKYLGLTETGTKTPSGIPTGIDHIKELGVTHVHILPMYDFGSVDENDSNSFNWGYDPMNYNVPEGSYSTDPTDGAVRVKEAKQMVKALHDNGISVVMDVVYNHVYNAGDFCFNQIVPGYFSRISDTGVYSNGSGCGNDTATERSMVKKYIVDSVKYWTDEYHIDGFRFDLVGLMDTELINEIVTEVHKDRPDVIFYGEGWSLTTDVTKSGYDLAVQGNSDKTPGFAYFNDTIRDGLRGNVFDTADQGFVAGNSSYTDNIKQTYLGFDVPYYLGSWCSNPSQTVNYASCHDNNTLIDRITISSPDASREEQVKMNNLAAAIYLTAQGIPFMQAGEEMLRTKVNEDGSFEHNSYKSSDEVNKIRWANLDNEEYKTVYEYYKGLIAFRKAHPALRLSTAEDVKANVTIVEGTPENTAAFRIKGGVNGEESEEIFVIFNANNTAATFTLPDGKWNVCVENDIAGTASLRTVLGGDLVVHAVSAMVLVKGNVPSAAIGNYANNNSSTSSNNYSVYIAIVAVFIVAIIAVVTMFLISSKKKKTAGAADNAAKEAPKAADNAAKEAPKATDNAAKEAPKAAPKNNKNGKKKK